MILHDFCTLVLQLRQLSCGVYCTLALKDKYLDF